MVSFFVYIQPGNEQSISDTFFPFLCYVWGSGDVVEVVDTLCHMIMVCLLHWMPYVSQSGVSWWISGGCGPGERKELLSIIASFDCLLQRRGAARDGLLHKTLQFINKQNRGRPRLLASSLEKVCGGGSGRVRRRRAGDDPRVCRKSWSSCFFAVNLIKGWKKSNSFLNLESSLEKVCWYGRWVDLMRAKIDHL